MRAGKKKNMRKAKKIIVRIKLRGVEADQIPIAAARNQSNINTNTMYDLKKGGIYFYQFFKIFIILGFFHFFKKVL